MQTTTVFFVAITLLLGCYIVADAQSSVSGASPISTSLGGSVSGASPVSAVSRSESSESSESSEGSESSESSAGIVTAARGKKRRMRADTSVTMIDNNNNLFHVEKPRERTNYARLEEQSHKSAREESRKRRAELAQIKRGMPTSEFRVKQQRVLGGSRPVNRESGNRQARGSR